MTQVTVCVSLILNHLSEVPTRWHRVFFRQNCTLNWTTTKLEHPFVFSFGAPFWAFFIIAGLTLAHPDPTVHRAEVAHILISLRIGPFAFLSFAALFLLLAIAIFYA